jgi:Co/Zn/Cd efflux system component
MSASCGQSHGTSGHGHSHDHNFDGASPGFRWALYAVIAINAIMFTIEMAAGITSGSMALKADSLDFLGDTVTYAISLWVIGKPLQVRATAALAKGVSLALMGAWVLGSTIYQFFVLGRPDEMIMGTIGVLAFVANVASVLILMRWREGDANVRSVWLCSRNDAIGNVFVVLAALGVWGTATGWPDLIVAGAMAAVFFYSAVLIVQQARGELQRASKDTVGNVASRPATEQ